MKLKQKTGLTLVEMLCTIVILLLVSLGMTGGVRLAVSSYDRSMMRSESEILASTLTSLVSDELRYSGTVDWESSPISFFSRTYGENSAFGQNDDGQVTLANNKLLPKKAYHYNMQATVQLSRVRDDIFGVVITVTDSKGNELSRSEFQVEKLNVGDKIS